MEQDIALSDVGENIILIHQGRYRLRDVLGSLKGFKAFQTIHFHKEGQI